MARTSPAIIKAIVTELYKTCTGADISRRFGISRQRIWELAKALRAEGFKIPRGLDKGYVIPRRTKIENYIKAIKLRKKDELTHIQSRIEINSNRKFVVSLNQEETEKLIKFLKTELKADI